MIVQASATVTGTAHATLRASMFAGIAMTAVATRRASMVPHAVIHVGATAHAARTASANAAVNGCIADPPERQFSRPFVSRQFARPFVSRQFSRPASE